MLKTGGIAEEGEENANGETRNSRCEKPRAKNETPNSRCEIRAEEKAAGLDARRLYLQFFTSKLYSFGSGSGETKAQTAEEKKQFPSRAFHRVDRQECPSYRGSGEDGG